MLEENTNSEVKDNTQGKKINAWFITKQILGFILTMLLLPMLFFGACFTGAIGWGSGSVTTESTLFAIVALGLMVLLFMSTRNYGVKAAVIILALFTISVFFGTML